MSSQVRLNSQLGAGMRLDASASQALPARVGME